MPITPPAVTTPYDNADYVLNLARAIVNDMEISAAGDLLADTQPYTFIYLNSGWRDLQDELSNSGVETFPAEQVITGIPVAGSTDPATQCYLAYDGFFDGVNNFTTPTLPQDMVSPLWLKERQSGTNQTFNLVGPANDGVPRRPKQLCHGVWEWRGDRIHTPGSLQISDWLLRYNKYLPDIAANGSAPVPILRCAKALAYYTASAFAAARGSPLADGLSAKGDESVQQMVNRTGRKKQRGNHRRQPYSRRGHGGWGWW